MDNNLIVKKLNSINWNFDFAISYEGDLLYPFNCRKYYSYPATFIQLLAKMDPEKQRYYA